MVASVKKILMGTTLTLQKDNLQGKAMKIEGAVVKEQGVTFAIVTVKQIVIQSQTEFQKAVNAFSRYFPRMPIVLMAQDSRGIPTYRGRKDIVNFLANKHISQIPWKEYTLN